jgi:hypothetical protein
MVDADVERLVDGVLAEAPAPLREVCDRAGILSGLLRIGAGDLNTLGSLLENDYAEVKEAVATSSRPAFVAALKRAVERSDGVWPLRDCGFGTPSTGQRPSPGVPIPPAVPLIVTIKFNNKVIAERTSIMASPSDTWERIATLRLEAVGETGFADAPLTVSVFRTAEQHASDRVGAAISDQVGPSIQLGYPHALLSFTAPTYGCARRPTSGSNPFAAGSNNPFSRAAKKSGGTLVLPEPYKPKEEGGHLNFELALFNAVLAQCQQEDLAVEACDLEACSGLILHVRDALWLMSGREDRFKFSKVSGIPPQPSLLQEGHGGGAADGAQAHRPAGGWRQEASQEEAEEEVEDAWLMLSSGLQLHLGLANPHCLFSMHHPLSSVDSAATRHPGRRCGRTGSGTIQALVPNSLSMAQNVSLQISLHVGIHQGSREGTRE